MPPVNKLYQDLKHQGLEVLLISSKEYRKIVAGLR